MKKHQSVNQNPQRAVRAKPSWLKRTLPQGERFYHVDDILKTHRLHTVCMSAVCPNKWECFGRGTATFLILGDVCTRGCRFCAVTHGKPHMPESDEPSRLADAVMKLMLRHVVITSVTRDDLPDGGAGHYRKTIDSVRKMAPSVTIEVLTPDFQGNVAALKKVIGGKPDVFAHNVEMVPRLYPFLRKKISSYQRSLDVLRRARMCDKHLRVKSGLMVGLGEEEHEIIDVMRDLAQNGVDILTIGQYLQPNKNCAEVTKFVAPKTFKYYYDTAKKLGIPCVFAGPFVRSSYRAEEALDARI